MTEWVITHHARERMLDRGIAQDQVDALLARPEISLPNPDLQAAPGTRLYIHGGVVAVIDEPEHTVITIGITGATNRDWESFSPPEAGPLPPQSPSLHHRRRRVKEKGLPVARRNVLDGVHPGIAAGVRAYLAAHNLDFRAVQVHGPMQVEINPPAAQ